MTTPREFQNLSEKTLSLPDLDATFTVGRHDALLVLRSDTLEIETGLHRVVWANRRSGNAFLLRFPNQLQSQPKPPESGVPVSTGNIRVKQRLHMPTMVSLTLLEALGRKRMVVKARAPVPRRLNHQDEDPTDFEKRVKIRRKTLVSTFMSDEDLIQVLEQGQMGRYVERAVSAHNAGTLKDEPKLSRYHVYQVAYRFWLHSCRWAGLLPDAANCGAPGKYRNAGVAKRGRPPNRVITGHAPDKPGINTGPDLRELIWMYWDLYGGKIGKYTTAYRQMVEEQFTEGWKENDKGIWVPDKETIANAPTLETFRYYIRSKYDPVELLRKLIPSVKWEQTKRALKGKAHEKLFGPAQTFMIDSTVADVYLVSQFNRYWIIGRPVVYFVRDVWSGMIVGLHVALEGPSWKTARFALYNAFSPKGEFLRAHGFNMTDADWPCAVGCLNLVHDRGEQLTIPSTDSAHDLGFVLSPLPPFRPDPKGSIETMFHWVNKATVQWMPGAVHARGKERGERDYRLDAVLTMQQFTRILIHAVLTFNNTADVSDRFDREMEEAGVANNPTAIWTWGLSNRNGSPPQWDKQTLYSALLPSGDACVRPDGVYFAGKRYAGSYSDQAQWQEYARAFRNKKIKVKYDSVRPHEVHVLNEATGHFETLTQVAGQKVPENSRLEEILDQVEYRKLVNEDQEDQRLLSLIVHKRFREQEVDNAIAARDAQVPPTSKAQHLAGIADKRTLEAAIEHHLNSGRARPSDIPVGTVPTTEVGGSQGVESDLVSELLAKIAEESANVAID